MAGRTLISRVAALFAENIASHGEHNKLNLVFTSHEPFLSFFALSGLMTGPSSELFSQLPSPGATLTFELYSVDTEERKDAESSTESGSESCDKPTSECHEEQNNSIPCSNDTKVDFPLRSCRSSAWCSSSNNAYPSTSNAVLRRTNPFPYPSIDNLYVRLLYSNGSSPTSPPVPCPLFGNTRANMSFQHFNATAWSIGVANATT